MSLAVSSFSFNNYEYEQKKNPFANTYSITNQQLNKSLKFTPTKVFNNFFSSTILSSASSSQFLNATYSHNNNSNNKQWKNYQQTRTFSNSKYTSTPTAIPFKKDCYHCEKNLPFIKQLQNRSKQRFNKLLQKQEKQNSLIEKVSSFRLKNKNKKFVQKSNPFIDQRTLLHASKDYQSSSFQERHRQQQHQYQQYTFDDEIKLRRLIDNNPFKKHQDQEKKQNQHQQHHHHQMKKTTNTTNNYLKKYDHHKQKYSKESNENDLISSKNPRRRSYLYSSKELQQHTLLPMLKENHEEFVNDDNRFYSLKKSTSSGRKQQNTLLNVVITDMDKYCKQHTPTFRDQSKRVSVDVGGGCFKHFQQQSANKIENKDQLTAQPLPLSKQMFLNSQKEIAAQINRVSLSRQRSVVDERTNTRIDSLSAVVNTVKIRGKLFHLQKVQLKHY